MADIINVEFNKPEQQDEITGNSVLEIAHYLLAESRINLEDKHTISMPIAELATLGAGVSSLLPTLRTVTQTTTISGKNLYELANATVNDTLKVAKNGNFWGAYKPIDGKSKFVQLKEASPLSSTTQTVTAINPATMLMAVALFSIEKELGSIREMEKQILTCFEIEKESGIEASLEMLMSIMIKYKYSWDNELFIAGNHQKVLDIQAIVRSNMNSYQKSITSILNSKQHFIPQNKVDATQEDLRKQFNYYRMSLYTFSLASLLEVLLSGNFNESYISGIIEEIRSKAESYRALFTECSLKLEEMGSSAVEANLMKAAGTAGKTIGRIIGDIPLIKESSVDEFLQDKGRQLQKNAAGMEKKAVKAFAALANPGTGVITDKLEDMIQIYNHTSQICFDSDNIYLIAN